MSILNFDAQHLSRKSEVTEPQLIKVFKFYISGFLSSDSNIASSFLETLPLK